MKEIFVVFTVFGLLVLSHSWIRQSAFNSGYELGICTTIEKPKPRHFYYGILCKEVMGKNEGWKLP